MGDGKLDDAKQATDRVHEDEEHEEEISEEEMEEIRERAQFLMAERAAGRARSLTDEENRRLIEDVLGPQ